jgi:transcriptional regulator with PAS, ATPase and Fis domain
VHELGPRRALPFVHVNCAALPETLLESELFGHVPGAFTGALRAKHGLFLEAAAGTIFLDEIDKTSRAFQSKLLHVLDRREVRPVGSSQWTPMAARVLAATNADLHALIARGDFLEDLYYRLHDIGLVVPPLRERVEDIPCRFAHILAVAARDASKCVPDCGAEVPQALARYRWPGNVRELENVARRILVLWDDHSTIELEHLPQEIQRSAGRAPSATGSSLREALAGLEGRMIHDAMARHRGNKSAVARELGLSYPTLLAKVRLYGLS